MEFDNLTFLFRFQQPFDCEIEHKLGVACVSSGPVLCRVSLDRGGYVPGETIIINATVYNRSKITVKSTKAALTEVRIQKEACYRWNLNAKVNKSRINRGKSTKNNMLFF